MIYTVFLARKRPRDGGLRSVSPALHLFDSLLVRGQAANLLEVQLRIEPQWADLQCLRQLAYTVAYLGFIHLFC
jgi:hypothetical protein